MFLIRICLVVESNFYYFYYVLRQFWMSKGPFTHSNEKAVIEASSTFHRSFIEFSVVMHEFFDDAMIFSMKYTFRNIFQKFKVIKTSCHRSFSDISSKNSCMTPKISMKRRWSFDDGIFDAMCKWALTKEGSCITGILFPAKERKGRGKFPPCSCPLTRQFFT